MGLMISSCCLCATLSLVGKGLLACECPIFFVFYAACVVSKEIKRLSSSQNVLLYFSTIKLVDDTAYTAQAIH
jgi:hypothetical protein